jgi:calcineurin-like phosphoesterase family protein
MIYFTADLHLGHANIIKHCNRPFESAGEMDEHLITRWNARVRFSDTVYVLGDLIFRSARSPESYLNRLAGKKHLILGNHDKGWVKKTDLSKHFASVERFSEISDGQHKMTLCHYPLMSWNNMSKGSYMIHGHIHNNRDASYFPLLRKTANLLNAGVDVNDFEPVNLDALIRNNETFKSVNTEKEEVDRMVAGFAPLAEALQGITERAFYQLSPIANDIIAGRITDEKEIDRHLTSMLDHCHDPNMLDLFKRVCRSQFYKHPELVHFYVYAYRDMWDSDIDSADEDNGEDSIQ